MKNVVRAIAVVAAIGIFVAFAAAAGAQCGHSKLKGQIIAFRPAERALQLASFVLNRESFLFKLSSEESNSQPVVTKLVYEHLGYSDLGSDFLDTAPTLRLTAGRDKTCDETYGAFVQNSPVLKEEHAEADSGVDKLIFVGPFQGMQLSLPQPLKCYKLRAGDFRIESSRPSH